MCAQIPFILRPCAYFFSISSNLVVRSVTLGRGSEEFLDGNICRWLIQGLWLRGLTGCKFLRFNR